MTAPLTDNLTHPSVGLEECSAGHVHWRDQRGERQNCIDNGATL